jgi:flagellar biosynthesis protein FlhA
MATHTDRWNAAAGAIARHQGLIVPLAAAALVLVILVPLPAGLMNVLLVGNIALAAVVLLMTMFVGRAAEFSTFPALLLGATLLRAVLSLAATRLILTCGADGRSIEQAPQAAGEVLWAFGQFVTSGSLAVGVVLFVALTIVQFAVVTKGAARLSEVAARFVLDALPGKQTAIDADLAASAITAEEAHRRREAVAREADFYGAMDGASKFLRGEAIALVLILLVNAIGGLIVGVLQYRWTLPETAELFSRLTIGAGLAMQVPAFLMAVAAALIVSRSNVDADLGKTMVSQLAARPVALVITAGLLGVLALTSLPKLPVLLLGGGCLGLALILHRRRRPAEAAREAAPPSQLPGAGPAAQNVADLLAVDAMRLELGFGLIGLVEPTGVAEGAAARRGGGLVARVAAVRRKIAAELGVIVPPIRIRDNMEMDSRAYAIYIRGTKVASGRAYPKEVLAVGSADAAGALMGRVTSEPASGAWAMWISPSQRAQAEAYTVADSIDVLVAHLEETITRHAADLLTRQQTAELLDNLKARAPALVAEVTGKLTTAQVQKVLGNLLRERVSIRDLEGILEVLCDAACQTTQTDTLTEQVRAALGRSLCQQFCDPDGKLACVNLSPALEQELSLCVTEGATAGLASIPPDVSKAVSRALGDGLTSLRRQGRRPVVVCAPQIRPTVRKLLAGSMPEAVVLGYNEIDSVDVESVASLGI